MGAYLEEGAYSRIYSNKISVSHGLWPNCVKCLGYGQFFRQNVTFQE